MSRDDSISDIIYVIHGSNVHSWWKDLISQKSDWWLPGSDFAKAMMESFRPPAQCAVRCHWWTGANSHEARIAAGIDLAQEIRDHCEEHQRIHIVGHSHGGNVGLLAVNRLPAGRISTLVLLANPNMALLFPQEQACDLEKELGPQTSSEVLATCGGSRCHWLYWGDAASRVERIFNLYSQDDTTQTVLSKTFHGLTNVRRAFPSGMPSVIVERSHPSDRVSSRPILWKPARATIANGRIRTRGHSAHSAMHSVKVGSLAGRLIQANPFEEAMMAAGLELTKPNRIDGASLDLDLSSAGDANPSAFTLPEPEAPPGQAEAGVLLVHGFTASAAETRPLAEYIHRQTGWLCHGVLLPGHGASETDLQKSTYQDWLRAVRHAFDHLVQRVAKPEKVFLVGISMGASLCCLLAREKQKDGRISGAILLAPAFAIPAWKRLTTRFLAKIFPALCLYKGKATERYFYAKRLSSYTTIPVAKVEDMSIVGDEAFKELKNIHVPIYLFGGSLEKTVSMKKMQEAAQMLQGLGRGHHTRFLKHSGHILTVEPDRRELFEECVRFMKSNCRRSL